MKLSWIALFSLFALTAQAKQIICFTSNVIEYDFETGLMPSLPKREIIIDAQESNAYTIAISTNGHLSTSISCALDRSTSYLLRLHCGNETVVLDYPALSEGRIVTQGYAIQNLVCRDISLLPS